LGQLSAAGKEPYLIFSARRCNECDENTSVYIHSPSDGAMKGKGLDDRSAYPGNYYAYDTGKLAARVRMFIGQCTEPSLEAAVWFTHEKIENGSWRDRVFVTSVINGELNSVEAATPLPRITKSVIAIGFVLVLRVLYLQCGVPTNFMTPIFVIARTAGALSSCVWH